MDDVEEFDELSLNLSTLSNNGNDNMEITSVIDNRVESIVKSTPIFDYKEQFDLFLQLKTGESTKKYIISTYDKQFQDYYEAAIDGKGTNYIVNYTLTKQANSYLRQSDSDTLFLFLYSKLTSTLSWKESAVFVPLIDHLLYNKNVYIPHNTADIRTKLLEDWHSL